MGDLNQYVKLPDGCIADDETLIIGNFLFVFDDTRFVCVNGTPSTELHEYLTLLSRKSQGRMTYCTLGELKRALQMSGFNPRVCNRVVECDQIQEALNKNK